MRKSLKKALMATLAGVFVVGASTTTFAQTNPFSDVPAGHWAYNAVTRLASEGIIEGYGDGTFRGNRQITRYEMAQMVAKALARIQNWDTSYAELTNAEISTLNAIIAANPDLNDAQIAVLEKFNEDEDLTAADVAALRAIVYGWRTGSVEVGTPELTDTERRELSSIDPDNPNLNDAQRLVIEKYNDGDELTAADIAALRTIIYSSNNTTDLTPSERRALRTYDVDNPNLNAAQRDVIEKFENGDELTDADLAALRAILYGGGYREVDIDIIDRNNPPSPIDEDTIDGIRQHVALTDESVEDLRKLVAYLHDDLDRLGVRVDKLDGRVKELDSRVTELEEHADMVKWTGKIEYTYGDLRNKYDKGANEGEHFSSGGHTAVFRLEPSAYVAKHWTANARFDANVNFNHDSTDDVKLKRIFAEGNYDKFTIKAGRTELFTPEDGLVWDTVISGVTLDFGSKWKVGMFGGRIGGGDEAEYRGGTARYGGDDYDDNPTTAFGINLQYNPGDTGLSGGVGYYHAKDEDFKKGMFNASEVAGRNYVQYSNDENYYNAASRAYNHGENQASVMAANIGYKFSEDFRIWANYAKNTKADFEEDGWQAQAQWGNYGDYANPGDWAIWGGYARFGTNVAIGSNQTDDVQTGTKGWHVGAAYAPFKNVGLLARYADGKYITGGDKFRKVFGRIELFF